MRAKSALVLSDSLQPYGLYLARLLCPWDSPGRTLEWVAMPSSRGSSQPQGSNLCLLHLLHWQMSFYFIFLPLAPPGKAHQQEQMSPNGFHLDKPPSPAPEHTGWGGPEEGLRCQSQVCPGPRCDLKQSVSFPPWADSLSGTRGWAVTWKPPASSDIYYFRVPQSLAVFLPALLETVAGRVRPRSGP